MTETVNGQVWVSEDMTYEELVIQFELAVIETTLMRDHKHSKTYARAIQWASAVRAELLKRYARLLEMTGGDT